MVTANDEGMTPRLELLDISKAYPGVVANDAITLAVAPGEIHAILGENGAGKSTLMKIIYGATSPDRGEIRYDGRVLGHHSPAQARALGIEMVYQHFSLFETATVAENIALCLPGRMDLPALSARIAETAARYGLSVEPGRLVADLGDDDDVAHGRLHRLHAEAQRHVDDRQDDAAQVDDAQHIGRRMRHRRRRGPSTDLPDRHDVHAELLIADPEGDQFASVTVIVDRVHHGAINPWRRARCLVSGTGRARRRQPHRRPG